MVVPVGVLALQGDFEKHRQMLQQIEVESVPVRYPQDLDDCSGLIIPGGESTTLTKQMKYAGIREPLLEFAADKPVFGTCAGLIMMADTVDDSRVEPLGLLALSVLRNGWGRQVHSSTERIPLSFSDEVPFRAIFIRAPVITDTGTSVTVLAHYRNQPVLVTDGRHLACTFHPELGDDFRIHEYFKRLMNV
ncbi:MAG: pyridoxal 5'-phosphate synthase glutaminase subunit PdxT [FCB group bacterium]|nr:pyridoxal 5'-phosphate synthase glutaminase subunit PdxT [FCB group bacterium]